MHTDSAAVGQLGILDLARPSHAVGLSSQSPSAVHKASPQAAFLLGGTSPVRSDRIDAVRMQASWRTVMEGVSAQRTS